MSREEYEAFKVLWRAEPYYVEYEAISLSCENYIEKLRRERKSALEELRKRGEEIADDKDHYLREIAWFEQNKEIVDIVHSALKRISQKGYKHQPFQNAYECACFLLSGDAFFRVPRRRELRPDEMPGTRPRVAGSREILNPSAGTENDPGVVFQDLYRGCASNAHSNVSPILRPPSDEKTITRRWERLMSFRRYIKDEHEEEEMFHLNGQFDDLLALAYMQHFKADAKLHPPMIDLTYDPFVALFFATRSARNGRTGAIYRFSLKADFVQFSKFSSLGHLSLVELPGIHRIRRQRALLFFCSSGEALDQLMPFHCEFLQHENVRFLDEELGITDEKLLHDDQGNVDFCKRFEKWSRRSEPNASEADTSLRPPSLHMETEELYQDVISWLGERDYEISGTGLREEIRKLVEFHSRLEQDAGIRPGTYTIRNLTEAAGKFAWGAGYFEAIGVYREFQGPELTGRIMQTAAGIWCEPVNSAH